MNTLIRPVSCVDPAETWKTQPVRRKERGEM
jgi:hypothetical protein